jgi:hypothetical protein
MQKMRRYFPHFEKKIQQGIRSMNRTNGSNTTTPQSLWGNSDLISCDLCKRNKTGASETTFTILHYKTSQVADGQKSSVHANLAVGNGYRRHNMFSAPTHLSLAQGRHNKSCADGDRRHRTNNRLKIQFFSKFS